MTEWEQRAIQELRERVDRALDILEGLKSALAVMKIDQAVSDERMDALNTRLGDMESASRWAVKLMIGAVILAIFGTVLRGAR